MWKKAFGLGVLLVALVGISYLVYDWNIERWEEAKGVEWSPLYAAREQNALAPVTVQVAMAQPASLAAPTCFGPTCEATCTGATCDEKTCDSTCYATCARTCDGYTCEQTCDNTCDYTCDRTCEQTCDNTCDYTCDSTCDNTCQQTCDNTCDYTCDSTCENTCQQTCDGTCDGYTCEQTCEETCEGHTCEGTCDNRTCEGLTCPMPTCTDRTCVGPTCAGFATCDTTCDGSACTDLTWDMRTCIGPTCDGLSCSDLTCHPIECEFPTIEGETCDFSTCDGPTCAGPTCEGRTCILADCEEWDFGDAPDQSMSPFNYLTQLANDGARHRINVDVYLGERLDPEHDGQPNRVAIGDDLEPWTVRDDEDGIWFPTSLIPGQQAIIIADASLEAYLHGWIDYDRSGDWKATVEHLFDPSLPLQEGFNWIAFDIPQDAHVLEMSYARFRFSTQTHLAYAGLAPDGEVEDYSTMLCPSYNVWIMTDDIVYRPMEEVNLSFYVDRVSQIEIIRHRPDGTSSLLWAGTVDRGMHEIRDYGRLLLATPLIGTETIEMTAASLLTECSTCVTTPFVVIKL